MANNFPQKYAYDREWGIKPVMLSEYESIDKNWKASRDLLSKIRTVLEQKDLPESILTIAAAGSLGRMEASDQSDGDLIIILSDKVDLNSNDATKAYDVVLEKLETIGIDPPNLNGVFSKPTNLTSLTDSIGKMDEPYKIFSKRLLLLLETQPVYNDRQYTKVIDNIIDKYARGFVAIDPKKEWTFLLNDLIRYFRSLAVNYQFSFNDNSEVGKWGLRNVKLRHSRLVMYSGLLMLLGESSKEREDKIGWLKQRLKMTPLERIAWVYKVNNESFSSLAKLYNIFLENINDETIRKQLNIEFEYEERYDNQPFNDLKLNSDALISELLRFVLARHSNGSWTERFFEYLIF